MFQNIKRPFRDETLRLMPQVLKSQIEAFTERLREFLDRIPEEADSLAEVSQKGLLGEFLSIYGSGMNPPSRNAKLISNSLIDDEYPDLPIVLALAHEDGALWDLLRRPNINGEMQINGLIERLSLMSPQQFITTSGMLAGASSAQMYVDLVRQLIDKHASIMATMIKSGPMEQERLNILWFSEMEKLTGTYSSEGSLDWTASSQSMKAKNAGLDFDDADYRHFLAECGVNVSMKERMKRFDSIFLTNAFLLLHTHQDTPAVLKNLTLKANVWAEIIAPGRLEHDRLVEQMVAAACFAHPEHFRRAGFNASTLAARHDETGLFRDTKDLLAGPLAFFSKSRMVTRSGQRFAEARLFEYARRLVPGFNLESLITKSGLSNRIIPALLTTVGGHHPVIDEALDGCEIPEAVAMDMIVMLGKEKAFGKYLPSTLLRILQVKLHDLPYRNADGDLVSYESLTDPDHVGMPLFDLKISEIEAARNNVFAPAYAQNPGLKQAMVEHLMAQPGITAKHLELTGISPEDNPEILRKMHLRDRGESFTSALGI